MKKAKFLLFFHKMFKIDQGFYLAEVFSISWFFSIEHLTFSFGPGRTWVFLCLFST
jgi:hypothetical protein